MKSPAKSSRKPRSNAEQLLPGRSSEVSGIVLPRCRASPAMQSHLIFQIVHHQKPTNDLISQHAGISLPTVQSLVYVPLSAHGCHDLEQNGL